MTTSPTSTELVQQLVDTLHRFLCLGIPHVAVRIGPDNYFKTSRAIAFWNGWKGKSADKPFGEMVVRPDYLQSGNFNQVVNTLKHELIHAWVDWNNLERTVAEGHGEPFITKAIELGVDIAHTLDVYPESRVIYERIKGEKVPVSRDAVTRQTVVEDLLQRLRAQKEWLIQQQAYEEEQARSNFRWKVGTWIGGILLGALALFGVYSVFFNPFHPKATNQQEAASEWKGIVTNKSSVRTLHLKAGEAFRIVHQSDKKTLAGRLDTDSPNTENFWVVSDTAYRAKTEGTLLLWVDKSKSGEYTVTVRRQ